MADVVEHGSRNHWDDVYRTRKETSVSWYQDSPEPSLALMDLAGAGEATPVIDIGGGASRLVDALLQRGYRDLTVLDISPAALEAARARLGPEARKVSWIASDVTLWQPERTWGIWHDRAAFHFLTQAAGQAAYVARLKQALAPGGHAIIGTFALDGPEKCSGLPIVRHSADSLRDILGGAFELTDHRRHDHVTPGGMVQKFQFSTFRRR